MMPRRMELLAPAGGPDSLRAAVFCGADAVYLGGQVLNARRGAENFDAQSLREAATFCRVRDVRLYLTLNTLAFDQEWPGLLDAIGEACDAGVDGVIVQDLGVARTLRHHLPDLPLHASTQMSVHNAEGARLLEELGFRRVVLARELSLEEIRRIADSTALELEVFVHGALCMSVSGQCTLSSMIGGRSGNRGLCAQPCRTAIQGAGREYALSLKDGSLVRHIPRLREAGVRSLKIEGRMKRPEYVAAATTACQEMLEGRQVDYETLEAVFSRSGFTDGYLTGQRGSDMFGARTREDVVAAAPVLGKLQALYRHERQRVPVEMTLLLTRDQPVELTVRDAGGHSASVTGAPPQIAVSAPTTPEKAAALLSKTGGTPYTIGNIVSYIDDGLMVPAAQINALRREALEQLTAQRAAGVAREFRRPPPQPRRPYRPPRPPRLRARLQSAGQLTPELLGRVDEIVLPLAALRALPRELVAAHAGRLLMELPRAVFGGQEDILEQMRQAMALGVQAALAGTLGTVEIARRAGAVVHGDFGLNVANTQALTCCRELGLDSVTLSFELELGRIAALGGTVPRGILAYGYLPLMLMRNCPAQPREGCSGCGEAFPELVDRLGNRFFLTCDEEAAELHNCVPLFLADRLGELEGVDFLTLYFTRETPEKCARTAALYREGGTLQGEKTRGLYYRKVR